MQYLLAIPKRKRKEERDEQMGKPKTQEISDNSYRNRQRERARGPGLI
jgi:hypothetical protein